MDKIFAPVLALCLCSPMLFQDKQTDSPATTDKVAPKPSVQSEAQQQREQSIRNVLSQPVTLEFVETPLGDVMEFLRNLTGENFVLHQRALDDIGVDENTVVTIHLENIPLAAAMKHFLRPLGCDFAVRHEVVDISSKDELGDQAETVNPNVLRPIHDKIKNQLDSDVTLEFIDTPVGDIVNFLRQLGGINILIDEKDLSDIGVSKDTPLSIHLENITLKSALKLMLRQMAMDSKIRHGALVFVSED